MAELSGRYTHARWVLEGYHPDDIAAAVNDPRRLPVPLMRARRQLQVIISELKAGDGKGYERKPKGTEVF